jgi:hypothetical protein
VLKLITAFHYGIIQMARAELYAALCDEQEDVLRDLWGAGMRVM